MMDPPLISRRLNPFLMDSIERDTVCISFPTTLTVAADPIVSFFDTVLDILDYELLVKVMGSKASKS
ncbi:hypothetical protein YC2023_124056 [Brassica napus]